MANEVTKDWEEYQSRNFDRMAREFEAQTGYPAAVWRLMLEERLRNMVLVKDERGEGRPLRLVHIDRIDLRTGKVKQEDA